MSSIFPDSALRCTACGAIEHEMDWTADMVIDDDGEDGEMGTPHLCCPNCGALDTAAALKERRGMQE